MRLAGRHAIVTGGGTGIGAAIAAALEAEGALVSRLASAWRARPERRAPTSPTGADRRGFAAARDRTARSRSS